VPRSFANAEDRRVLHTKLRMVAEEFDHFVVDRPQYLIFALAEFKAMLTLAQSLKCTVVARFGEGGTPIVLMLSIADVLDVRLIISTSAKPDAAAEPEPAAAAVGTAARDRSGDSGSGSGDHHGADGDDPDAYGDGVSGRAPSSAGGDYNSVTAGRPGGTAPPGVSRGGQRSVSLMRDCHEACGRLCFPRRPAVPVPVIPRRRCQYASLLPRSVNLTYLVLRDMRHNSGPR